MSDTTSIQKPAKLTADSVLFVGAGKMMQAIAGGLLATPAMASSQLVAIEPDAATTAHVRAMFGDKVKVVGHTSQLETALHTFGSVVLAVKPQAMADALAPLAGRLASSLVLSIAAGVRIRTISTLLGIEGTSCGVVRAMPNTPALIGKSITGVYADPSLEAAMRARAATIVEAVGKVVWLAHEADLDAVTAVSGSGPAYVFYFIEALEAAAIELGISAASARLLALETFRGAALLAADSTESPMTLRQNVTSRKGTTEAAIAALDAAAAKTHFAMAVRAARDRAEALANELEADARKSTKP